MTQASKNITVLLKWYGHVTRIKEEHIVGRMIDVDMPGKRKEGGYTYDGKMLVREI